MHCGGRTSILKRALKIVAIVLAVILVIAIGYVAYVFIAYHRLPDTDEAVEPKGAPVAANAPLTIATWNLGFGAYSDDYGFFMDGGKEPAPFPRRP